MRVQKIGHCCLVIDVDGVRVMTDPGCFSTGQDAVTGIDVIVITHEHADHLHVLSLQSVLFKNPDAVVVCNSAVGKLLAGEKIPHTILEGTAECMVGELSLRAHDARHEEIYEEIGQVHNTGYLIARKLFYPGDAFAVPGYSVDVLALPVAGPWCSVPNAIRYALVVHPRVAFPVHDAVLNQDRIGSAHSAPVIALAEKGIQFVPLKTGESAEF